MTTRDVTLLLAMLAVVAEGGVAVAVIVVVGGRWSSRLAGWRDSLVELFGPVALHLALGVALVATLGSLYLSEIANFPPCRLCWYQRIAMYALVPILAAAPYLVAVKADGTVAARASGEPTLEQLQALIALARS